MANHISDETIDYVGILAKLALSGEEKEQAKQDMEKMLDYIDQLNELDTSGKEFRHCGTLIKDQRDLSPEEPLRGSS